MCGIFAYLCAAPRARADVVETLLTGLQRLEYRGYDSAGLAVDSSESDADAPDSTGAGAAGRALVFRSPGKIAALRAHVEKEAAARGLDVGCVAPNQVGIAHTRWATHGPPSARNAHPHASDNAARDFVVVHNGIITNYKALRTLLEAQGVKFESDTDTEVVPKLAKYYYDLALSQGTELGFVDLVTEVVRALEGAYALLFKSRHFPGELVGCKRGSPLILAIKDEDAALANGGGTTDGPKVTRSLNRSLSRSKTSAGRGAEYFLSSDASAVVEHTKSVIVLEDDEMVHLHDGEFETFRFERDEHGAIREGSLPSKVQRAINMLEMEAEQIMKGSYDHFMQKEINEQPESLANTMRGRVFADDAPDTWANVVPPNPRTLAADAAAADAAAEVASVRSPTATQVAALSSLARRKRIFLGGVNDFLPIIRRSHRLVLVGCGTSYNACLATRPAFEELCGTPVSLELASDIADRACPIMRDDTCIFVSQSGETKDTLDALDYAAARGALTVGITNTVGSAISMRTQCGVHINAGAEIGVASTKAYTSQIVTLVMLALALSEDSLTKLTRRIEVIDALAALPENISKALELAPEMEKLAKKLTEQQSLLVLGRGYHYATAMETALKVKEVTLMHSEGVLSGEIKHGPLALVDENLPIIVVATRDRNYAKNLSCVEQLCARHGWLMVLAGEGDTELERFAKENKGGTPMHLIKVPETVDCLQGVVNIVPMQLLSYYLACIRGLNVDQPRNLAKSVTVQ